jgi:methionine-rich copper-binding protein CopC
MYRIALPGLAFLLLQNTAMAHAILIDSAPAPNGHVAPGHLQLTFRYNSRIDSGRSKLTLKRPDDSTQRLAIEPADKPDILKASLDLTPGDYVVAWQVLATDGHITRGTIPFTVDAQPAKPGTPQAATQ